MSKRMRFKDITLQVDVVIRAGKVILDSKMCCLAVVECNYG